MTRTTKLLLLSIGLASGTLTLGYALTRLWVWTGLSIIIGLLWFLESRQYRDWSASFFLIGWIGMAAGGIRMGAGAGWMLVSLVAGLTAWDLHHFVYRLRLIQEREMLKRLEYAHLRRLLIVDGLGIVFAGLTLTIHLTVNFGITLVLAALAIVCLSQFLNFLRRESD
jgi:hypothetical protein